MFNKRVFLLLSLLVLSFGRFIFPMKKHNISGRFVTKPTELHKLCLTNDPEIVEQYINSECFDAKEVNSPYSPFVSLGVASTPLSSCIELLSLLGEDIDSRANAALIIKMLLKLRVLDVNCVAVDIDNDSDNYSCRSIIYESYGSLYPELIDVILNCDDSVLNTYRKEDLQYLKHVLLLSVCIMSGDDELYKSYFDDFSCCTDDKIKRYRIRSLKKYYVACVRNNEKCYDGESLKKVDVDGFSFLLNEPFKGFCNYTYGKKLDNKGRIERNKICEKFKEFIDKIDVILRKCKV